MISFSQIRFRKSEPDPQRMDSWERGVYPNVLRVLDPFLEGIFFAPSQVVDVGCRNWSYLEALVSTFPKAQFLGVEVDGSPLYINLYRRRDQANVNARRWTTPTRKCTFQEVDFRQFKIAPCAALLVTFFFPFVSKDPCLEWGMSEEYSVFEELLMPIKRAQGKTLVASCHQGKWERDLAFKAYKQAGFHVKLEEKIEIPEHPYPLYLIVASPEL